jgi:predicted amidohydrolase
MKNIRVGLIQPYVDVDNEKNFLHIESLIQQAVDQNAQILCLPERWFFVDPIKKPFECNLQPKRGQQYSYVKQWAKEYNIPLISGAIWEQDSNFSRPVITAYYFDRNGIECFQQQKIHLYGIERDMFSSGNELVCYTDTKMNLTFSILICFDLNISNNLARLSTQQGCEFLFSPTLIRDTGMENWKIYVQSRALENRMPLCSCNSIFTYLDRQFMGRSKIIHFKRGESSPVKLLVEEMTSLPGVLVQDINLSFPNRIRTEREDEHVDFSKIRIRAFKN